jgi:hypothetical protein
VLALVLALFGFVLAPLLHTVTHEHGHAHHHQGKSLEHFTLATHAAPPELSVIVLRVAVDLERVAEVPSPRLEERRRSEQAQGPPARG